MGKPVAGDVVVLPFPQTNLQPGKRRPALVVAELPGDDLIRCQITTRLHSDSFAVPLTAADFVTGRLATDSYARSNRLFTVEASVILYSAGRVTPAKLNEVKAKLRELFAYLMIAVSVGRAHVDVGGAAARQRAVRPRRRPSWRII